MEEEKCKGLSHGAYGGIEGEDYEPYIPPEKEIPEMTPLSIGLGLILSALFGAVMTYTGLKIGMTVSASIPAAVISMLILKGVFRRGTILENNIVQTITSSGESVAAGIIFTIPAAFFWASDAGVKEPFTVSRLVLIALIGGILGVLLMIPLRNYLIVREHGKLKYPEGTAGAEVLVAGDVGGNPAKMVVSGIAVGGIYKFLQKSMEMWKETVSWKIPIMKNLEFSAELTPILLGVGYIIGLKVALFMVAGGFMAWFVFIPLITHFLGSSVGDAHMVWNNYIRYIGAGAVAMGGLLSLMKSMPVIWSSFKAAFKELVHNFKHNGKNSDGSPIVKKRTFMDIPIQWCVLISIVLIILIVFTKNISNNFFFGAIGGILVFIFGFFFVTVSSRIVGLIGSSSNPVSGMTIGTLIVSTIIFYSLGFRGYEGMITSLVVGAFVCIAMSMAGDISQDLKTGFLVGATPWRQQVGQILGIASSAFFVVMTVNLLKSQILDKSLVAPQANLSSMIIKGIMEGSLPWNLVFIGAFIALIVELCLGISALPFAVGFYLPLSLSTPLLVGGFLAKMTSDKFKDPKEFKERNEKGILISSGLIAGDALVGLIIIVLAVKNYSLSNMIATKFPAWKNLMGLSWPALAVFLGVTAFLWYTLANSKDKKSDLTPPVCEANSKEVSLSDKTIDDYENPLLNIPYQLEEQREEKKGFEKINEHEEDQNV